MKKKNVLWLMMFGLASSVFVACNKNSDPDPSGTTTGTTNSAEVHEAAADYTWNSADVIPITLNGTSITVNGKGATVAGSKVTITAAGTYSFSGTLTNGQIIVNTEDKATVRLILNGVDITTANSSPIYIKKSEKTIIVLADNSQNKLTDGTSYVYDDTVEQEPNATIFSKSNLTIFGNGALTVKGNFADGIASKDGLIIKSGTINVTANDDGIRGKDYLIIKDGNITVTSKADALKSNNDNDTALGYLIIEKGTMTISAGDDGIHAESKLVINGGDINITKSYEGLESKAITINDGTIHLVSSDDGINAAGGSTGTQMGGQGGFSAASTYTLDINGGYIYVNSSGDGLDANGSITMTNGVAIVHGPSANGNGALDYDGSFKITGGLLIAVGSSGMAQIPGTTSTQNSVLVSFAAAQNAGAIVNIQNSEGKDILTFKPLKKYQSLAFSSPDLIKSSTYNVYLGGSATGTETDGLIKNGTYTLGTKSTSFTVSTVATKVSGK